MTRRGVLGMPLGLFGWWRRKPKPTPMATCHFEVWEWWEGTHEVESGWVRTYESVWKESQATAAQWYTGALAQWRSRTTNYSSAEDRRWTRAYWQPHRMVEFWVVE